MLAFGHLAGSSVLAATGLVLAGSGCARSSRYALHPVAPVEAGKTLPPREYAERLARELPQHPKPLPPFLASFVYEFPWVGSFLDARPETAGTLGGYKRIGPFEVVQVPVSDGLELAGRMSIVDRPVSWVILVHGALRSGAQKHIYQQAAVLRSAGFGVLALDMREHGLSWEETAGTASLGWREGLDLVRAAEWLRDARNAEHVAVVGTSLGGRYALRAAIEASRIQPAPIDAVVAVVPAVDLPAAAADLEKSTRAPLGFNAILWRSALRNRDRRSARLTGIEPVRRWSRRNPYRAGNVILDYIENVIVPRWHFESLAEWKRKSDPVEGLGEVTMPVLVYAVRDDPFVRIWQTEELLRPAAGGNRNIGFVIARRGGHTAFAIVDPNFFYNVTTNFLEAFATGKPAGGRGNRQDL